MTLFDLTGRLALVTGSSRGLGETFARGLGEAGAQVVLHGRDPATLAAAAERHEAATGRAPLTVVFDVTDPDQVRSRLDELVAAHGVPDVLVNNAGTQSRAPFPEVTAEAWDDVIATNLSSAFHVSRALAGGMVERGSGKIVHVASVQSRLARRTIAPYAAAKGGLVLLAQGMAADLAPHGVQVNALSPGYFATEMNQALVADPSSTPGSGRARRPGAGAAPRSWWARWSTSARTRRASSAARTSSSTGASPPSSEVPRGQPRVSHAPQGAHPKWRTPVVPTDRGGPHGVRTQAGTGR